jgi:hypothetical protein
VSSQMTPTAVAVVISVCAATLILCGSIAVVTVVAGPVMSVSECRSSKSTHRECRDTKTCEQQAPHPCCHSGPLCKSPIQERDKDSQRRHFGELVHRDDTPLNPEVPLKSPSTFRTTGGPA